MRRYPVYNCPVCGNPMHVTDYGSYWTYTCTRNRVEHVCNLEFGSAWIRKVSMDDAVVVEEVVREELEPRVCSIPGCTSTDHLIRLNGAYYCRFHRGGY